MATAFIVPIALDTNVWMDLMVGEAKAKAWFRSMSHRHFIMLGIVAMELVRNCDEVRGSVSMPGLATVQNFISNHFPSQLTNKDCLDAYNLMMTEASRAFNPRVVTSKRFGVVDTLIAVSAANLGADLYTRDKHMLAIPSFKALEPYRILRNVHFQTRRRPANH